MSAISSIVKRRISSTFCIEPADTATPHIAGAMAGSHSDELSTGSFEQLFDCRSPIGVGVLSFCVKQNSIGCRVTARSAHIRQSDWAARPPSVN
jgi:hypothetical protein